RPNADVLPGVAVALLGVLATALVWSVPASPLTGGDARHGWLGAPLLVVGCGLLWALLGACRRGVRTRVPGFWPRRVPAVRVAAALGVVAVAGLAVGAAVGGRQGPLHADGGVR